LHAACAILSPHLLQKQANPQNGGCMEPIPKQEMRVFALPALSPAGHLLVLNRAVGIATLLTLQQDRAPILGQCALTKQMMTLLVALLEASPHYCSHQRLHAVLSPTAPPLDQLPPQERAKRKKLRWFLIEQLKAALAPLGLHTHSVPGQGYYIAPGSPPAAGSAEPPVRYFAQEALFPTGRVLAVHPGLSTASLLELACPEQPITTQFCFSPSALQALVCLLDTYPYCCLYRQVFDRLYPASPPDLDGALVRRPVFRAMEQLDKGLSRFGLALYPARALGYHLRHLANTTAHPQKCDTHTTIHHQLGRAIEMLPRLNQRFVTR
jgi:hypothetical protein